MQSHSWHVADNQQIVPFWAVNLPVRDDQRKLFLILLGLSPDVFSQEQESCVAKRFILKVYVYVYSLLRHVLHNFTSICPSPSSCGGEEFFFLRIQNPPNSLVLYIPIPLNLTPKFLPQYSDSLLGLSTQSGHSIRLTVKEKKWKAPSTQPWE